MNNEQGEQEKGKGMTVSTETIAFKPANWTELWNFATLICKTEFVPPQFKDNPGACLAAIQTGHELGLPPMASLQSIAVINGHPTVWGDGALALIKAHPLCEWVHELPAQEAEKSGYGECSIRRKGDPEPITRRFSLEMAQKAGLIQRSGEKGVWATYRGRMLQMRARAWAMRDAIPEALKGVAIREEIEDYEIEVVDDKKELPAPKPALEQLKENLKAETKNKSPVPQATIETVAEPQVEGARQPITGNKTDDLLTEIRAIGTVMGLAEFRYGINKKLKDAGIKDEASIQKISDALNEKKAILEKV